MPTPYFSFLLRLWQSADASRWQASLEDPHTHQVTGFDDLERLYAFLTQLQPVETKKVGCSPSSDYNEAGANTATGRDVKSGTVNT